MSRWFVGMVFVVAGFVSLAFGGSACGQGSRDNGPASGSQQGDRHDPFSRNYADFSRGYSQAQFRRGLPPGGSATGSRSFVGGLRGSIGVSGILVYPYVYGYGLYSDYPYSLTTDSGTFGPYIAPPVVVSGNAQFGPQAVRRFMGVEPVPGPQAQPLPRPRRIVDVDAAPIIPPADHRARQKAWNLIDQGDAEFVQRRFAQALLRYRDAAAAARDLAEAQFRQGFALVAMARFADAAKAFRHGLQLDPEWADSGFHLDELYGANKILKQSHLDALRKAVKDHPHDPDALFVLGVCLYFDDQIDAAAPLFRRAVNVLGPQDSDHLDGFLKHLPSEKKPADGNVEANKPAAKVPPPPLPAPDKPADKKPLEKPSAKPADPFEGLDI
ncbi:MAG TPA: tetratricopeptide repeat protein [Pirellulales bacterium]|nr:tetratricopeptide repeat protein [Pirellulales bacterium]